MNRIRERVGVGVGVGVQEHVHRTCQPDCAAAESASEEEVLAARVPRHYVLLEDDVAIDGGDDGIGERRRVLRGVTHLRKNARDVEIV